MRLFLTSLIFILLSHSALAIKVKTVKNSRVLLELEGAAVNVGDKLGVRDADGKARAMLEVTQVKNDRALATILKGQVQEDYSVAILGAAPTATSVPKKTRAAKKSRQQEGAWGVMAGYAMNTMTVKPTGASSISLSGSSFNLSGLYDMKVGGNFSARILGGYETLVATGGVCSGSECSVDISYLGIEALGRYTFVTNSTLDFWGGAGLGFLFAMSKSSNVLDTSKISTNQTIVGALGVDYHLSKESFIPVQLDYAMYPDNNTSSASQIILRFGYGLNF